MPPLRCGAACGQDVCARTRPDAAGPSTTSTDTVRTHPDPDAPDASGQGVRIEYRARVPRHLAPAAPAEAFQAITDARADQEDPAGPAPDGVPRCTATWDSPLHGGPGRCWRAASHNDDERRAFDAPLHTGRNSTGTRYQWSDSDDGAHPHLPNAVQTSLDEHPDTGVPASGRTRPAVLGTAPASADTVRTGCPDTMSGRPDGEPGPSGIRGLLEHVGIDLTGRCISVGDQVVDHAPACSCEDTVHAPHPEAARARRSGVGRWLRARLHGRGLRAPSGGSRHRGLPAAPDRPLRRVKAASDLVALSYWHTYGAPTDAAGVPLRLYAGAASGQPGPPPVAGHLRHRAPSAHPYDLRPRPDRIDITYALSDSLEAEGRLR